MWRQQHRLWLRKRRCQRQSRLQYPEGWQSVDEEDKIDENDKQNDDYHLLNDVNDDHTVENGHADNNNDNGDEAGSTKLQAGSSENYHAYMTSSGHINFI